MLIELYTSKFIPILYTVRTNHNELANMEQLALRSNSIHSSTSVTKALFKIKINKYTEMILNI